MKRSWMNNVIAICGLGLMITLFSACGNKNDIEKEKVSLSQPKTIKFLSMWKENEGPAKILIDLTNEYKKQNPNVNLEVEVVQQTDLVQKVKIAAASGDLPDLFCYESGKPLSELAKEGAVVDIGKAFEKIGIFNQIDSVSVELMKQLSDSHSMYGIPRELNFEGIWYNKKIFEANHLSVPTTLPELLDVAQKLKNQHIQPFVVAGKEKWPITRLINMLVMRKLGTDAMLKVAKGDLSLNSPDFIWAAKVVQDMAAKGYFGNGVNTIDYGNACDIFLNEKAAMIYNGSWFIRDLNNEEKNRLLGRDGVGFFNFPTVDGGIGTLGDYSANCGIIVAMASDKYDEQTADWAKFVFSKFGDYAMNTQGVISSFKTNNFPNDLPPYTRLSLAERAKIQNTGLWFEGKFDTRTQDLAYNNAQLLVLGRITPEEYMEKLDQAVKLNASR